jgi:uncharacterized protein
VTAAAVAVVVALAASTPAAPTRWVEDHAGFLSTSTRDALDGRLEAYQTATGHQVVVWIGRSTGEEDLAEWAVATFAAWKLGRAGIDDGVAMFVLADDHAIDIEVGYGLEDRVPDAVAHRIIADVMTPKLQAGDRDGAITAGVDALLAAIEGKPWTGSTSAPPSAPTTLEWILGALGVLAFIVFAIRHPRAALLLLTIGRGGGGGGGGRRGFSGGGGRSGGGGARGKW